MWTLLQQVVTNLKGQAVQGVQRQDAIVAAGQIGREAKDDIERVNATVDEHYKRANQQFDQNDAYLKQTVDAYIGGSQLQDKDSEEVRDRTRQGPPIPLMHPIEITFPTRHKACIKDVPM